jgi:flagellar basal body-associated protein FliL
VKQGISPAVAVVVILIVVIVVGVVGYFVFMKPKAKGSAASPEDMKARMEQAGAYMQKQQQDKPGGAQGGVPEASGPSGK